MSNSGDKENCYAFGVPLIGRSIKQDRYKAQLKRENGILFAKHYLSLNQRERRKFLKSFKWSRQRIAYWIKKELDSSHQSKSNGGDNRCKDLIEKSKRLKRRIIASWRMNPFQTLRSLRSSLGDEDDVPSSDSTILNWIKEFGMTYKKVYFMNNRRQTLDNTVRYISVLDTLRKIPIHKIKFLDEYHFVSSQINKPRAYFPCGYAPFAVVNKRLDLRFSLSLITSLTPGAPLIHMQVSDKGNGETHYCQFLESLCSNGIIMEGDVLVMDNARTHSSSIYSERIQELIDIHKFEILFLPTYSPELNPCELVFSVMKGYIRKDINCFRSKEHFSQLLLQSANTMTTDIMVNFYNHCLGSKFSDRNGLRSEDVDFALRQYQCDPLGNGFYSISPTLTHEINEWVRSKEENRFLKGKGIITFNVENLVNEEIHSDYFDSDENFAKLLRILDNE